MVPAGAHAPATEGLDIDGVSQDITHRPLIPARTPRARSCVQVSPEDLDGSLWEPLMMWMRSTRSGPRTCWARSKSQGLR